MEQKVHHSIFGRFHIPPSIKARVRFSFVVIMVLLIVPVLISAAFMINYSGQYHSFL